MCDEANKLVGVSQAFYNSLSKGMSTHSKLSKKVNKLSIFVSNALSSVLVKNTSNEELYLFDENNNKPSFPTMAFL